MKRTSLLSLALLLITALVLAACSPSPKALADDFVKYLPEEIGEWERDDDATVKLQNNTVSSIGHVIMLYEGPDDALAYIVVIAHPSEDAAKVAAMDLQRTWQMQGLELDEDRPLRPSQATAVVAQTDRIRYALFQEQDLTVEINVIAENAETPISDEAFDILLDTMRAAFEKVFED